MTENSIFACNYFWLLQTSVDAEMGFAKPETGSTIERTCCNQLLPGGLFTNEKNPFGQYLSMHRTIGYSEERYVLL